MTSHTLRVTVAPNEMTRAEAANVARALIARIQQDAREARNTGPYVGVAHARVMSDSRLKVIAYDRDTLRWAHRSLKRYELNTGIRLVIQADKASRTAIETKSRDERLNR